ncbi:hydrolase 1, exosortase A system-associated [Chitinivorax sp. PXF-14]|uniref:hydrolase 1, exosortase A system-associated n=1 Tax=Chitinivorax sp. PXF-14 TaxID=3230488 RepID=UPI003466DFB0
MSWSESALTFDCQGESLPAIISLPANGMAERGVLIVVGGPQYRAGSHRQFVLLARHLARHGIAAMRFDYRGMGDAGGELHNFEQIDDDLRAAIDAFQHAAPAVREVVIWGLCDAASAALFYAWRDKRVTGLVLLNPWVRTEAGLARAYIKHYYRQRLLSAEFWRKLLCGGVDLKDAWRSLVDKLAQARQPAAPVAELGLDASLSLPDRMCEGLRRFAGRVLLVLSGDDLTAAEFREAVAASPDWQAQLAAPRVTQRELAEANHTFSRREWRDRVADWTLSWVRE